MVANSVIITSMVYGLLAVFMFVGFWTGFMTIIKIKEKHSFEDTMLHMLASLACWSAALALDIFLI